MSFRFAELDCRWSTIDGKIDVDDYGIIDFNVGIQGPPLSSAAPSGEAKAFARESAPLPLLSRPISLLESTFRDRDVFDSIFATADVL